MSERDLVYPDINWCPACGLPITVCDCTEDDMNRWAYDELYGDEELSQPMWELYPLELDDPNWSDE